MPSVLAAPSGKIRKLYSAAWISKEQLAQSFCNCVTGIADDKDLEQRGDLALIGSQVEPLDVGRQITVGSMHGRSRTYGVRGSNTDRDPRSRSHSINVAIWWRLSSCFSMVTPRQWSRSYWTF